MARQPPGSYPSARLEGYFYAAHPAHPCSWWDGSNADRVRCRLAPSPDTLRFRPVDRVRKHRQLAAGARVGQPFADGGPAGPGRSTTAADPANAHGKCSAGAGGRGCGALRSLCRDTRHLATCFSRGPAYSYRRSAFRAGTGLRPTSIAGYWHRIRDCAGLDGVGIRSRRCPARSRPFHTRSLFDGSKASGGPAGRILDGSLDWSWPGHAKPPKPRRPAFRVRNRGSPDREYQSIAGWLHLDKLYGLYQRLEEALPQIPGVLSSSLSGYSPLAGNNWNERVYIEGKPPDYRWTAPSWNRVGPHYFETIGTRLLQGRAIDERDGPAAPHVAVINETFARRFFPNENPIGQHFGRGD